ncbi:MAG: hypothetical protein L0Z49_07645, partial [Actinobacteria bacterium]|nr:hypothetical protein [Actinomycetota bacterium]
VAASMDAAETTTFRKNDKTYIVGLRDVTVNLSGLFASSGSTGAGASTDADGMAEYFDGALGGSTRQAITILPDSTAIGGRALLMVGDAMAWDVSAPVSDVVSAEVEFQGSEGYRGGRILRYQVASTSTGAQSAVDSGLTNGGSSGGGVGHLHVTAVSSTFGSATFKIQHSTSGSTWADLITFTAATARTFQRSTVAGTIKEQVRSTLSSYTGTAGADSITATIAFARQAGPNRN